MSKIICFGSAGKDIFFPTDDGKIIETPDELTSQKKIAFELGAKIKIENRFEALGGCAANVAVGVTRLGIEAACVSNVGSDAISDWIILELEKNKVKTDFIKKEEGKKSDLSAIVVDEKSADRVIFTNKNSSGKLNLYQVKQGDAKWFFISDVHGSWEDQVETIITIAQEEKKLIAFNPREVYIKENLPEVLRAIASVELVFLNKDEAIEIISQGTEKYSNEELNDEKFLLEKLKALGAKIVVITDGKRGAWAMNDDSIFFVESLSVNAVDSTGAGDAFCSGFLTAHIKEKELGECLRWGIANSASVVEHYGAIDGLLSEKEILEKTKKVAIEKL